MRVQSTVRLVFAILAVYWLSSVWHVSATPQRSIRMEDMPILALPYGSFRASYNPLTDIYTFHNIPFAAPPTGDLRWRKPESPITVSGIQDGNYGPHCPQGSVGGFNIVGPGNRLPLGRAINQLFAGLPTPDFSGASEDCLYLDVYVPGKALMDGETLPVAVWVFGGAYVMGSKDIYQPMLPYYDGSGFIRRSQNDLIFVAFNYRLGSFGWLAGTTMEEEGLPNAGLWDQRAAFQWVQDYIHLVGGDPNEVTAIGESAGAGSLEYHLIARGGTLDPLFKRAILMSPAFQPM